MWQPSRAKPKKDISYIIKCTECGKLIAYDDIEKGLATCECVLPDSDYSVETYENYCKRCLPKALEKDWSFVGGIAHKIKKPNNYKE